MPKEQDEAINYFRNKLNLSDKDLYIRLINFELLTDKNANMRTCCMSFLKMILICLLYDSLMEKNWLLYIKQPARGSMLM